MSQASNGGLAFKLGHYLEGNEVDARRILTPGQTVTIDLDLKPATYHAICRPRGHREAGMVVTVEVRQ